MDYGPLTSVVIPAYNAERFIERTLDSALRQTHTNLEVIVVDDGSTDATKTKAKVAAQKDARVRVISIANGGVANARNRGLEEAKGEFVAFLDADDLWHPTKVERQLVKISQGVPGLRPAAVYVLSRTIDVNDGVIGDGARLLLEGYCFAQHLYSRPVGNGSSLLVRREVALAVGGFNPAWAAQGIGGCEDVDFELKIAGRYPIGAIGLYLVGYRQYAGNMSSNSRAMANGALSTVEHHISSCPELPSWVVRSARAAISEYALAKLLGARQRRLLMKELARLLRIDVIRGLEFAAMVSSRKLGSLIGTAPERAVPSLERPHFYDLSPESAQAYPDDGRSPRDRKMLRRLKAVDKTLAQKRCSSTG